jgi:hypothetical protein
MEMPTTFSEVDPVGRIVPLLRSVQDHDVTPAPHSAVL